ncbi:hypothetical protein F4821DRAFT_231947 [Hypoxylon rubiginosum]|uniref:Uncharacterized protein n=1 Tax=Hypoxylon rubiginosum TaxID=110542 RepID=A0ACC0D8G9_9PEZI|nr:hypothetical protein F4821DRAFT_231947 [Hypoxylon rubiginosum]
MVVAVGVMVWHGGDGWGDGLVVGSLYFWSLVFSCCLFVVCYRILVPVLVFVVFILTSDLVLALALVFFFLEFVCLLVFCLLDFGFQVPVQLGYHSFDFTSILSSNVRFNCAIAFVPSGRLIFLIMFRSFRAPVSRVERW